MIPSRFTLIGYPLHVDTDIFSLDLWWGDDGSQGSLVYCGGLGGRASLHVDMDLFPLDLRRGKNGGRSSLVYCGGLDSEVFPLKNGGINICVTCVPW